MGIIWNLITWLFCGFLAECLVLGTWKNTTLVEQLWERMVIERYNALSQWKAILLGPIALVAVLAAAVIDGEVKSLRLAIPPASAAWFGKLFKKS